MMIKELKLTRRKKLLGAVIICALTITVLMIWYTRPVAEASMLNPHPGLVGWWRFDEGSGTVAKDSSGNGNDGTVYGATWVDGKYSKALSFDGVNGYVDCGTWMNGWSEGTWSAWFYINAFPAGDGFCVVNTRVASGQVTDFWINYAGYFQWYVWNGTTQFQTPYFHIYAGQWYHVVGTWKNGEPTKAYVNGVLQLVGGVSFSGSIQQTKPFYIGRDTSISSRVFNGIIDEVRIYNRALSAAEIQEIFQNRPDFSSKLLARVPEGTTQVIVTVSWQGVGTINAAVETPSKTYTESDVSGLYQKNAYSTIGGTSDMLNIKRLSVSVSALSSDENWYIVLTFDNVEDYKITVEVQK